jgi:hypothetical protein
LQNKQTDLDRGKHPATGVIPEAQAIAGSNDTTHLQNLEVQNSFKPLLSADEEIPNKEVNNELVISNDSLTCSEFIDATQLNNEDIEIKDHVVVTSPNKWVLERVREDIEFLKESWANMAENEDNEAIFFFFA